MSETIVHPIGPLLEGIFENTDKSKELVSALNTVNSLAETVTSESKFITDEQVFKGALDKLYQAFIESKRAKIGLYESIDESAQLISAEDNA